MKLGGTRALILAAAGAAVLLLPGASLFYKYSSGAACAGCHEITRNYDVWQASSHRTVPCGACHGEALTLDPGFHLSNARRLLAHVRGNWGRRIRIKAADLPRMIDHCRECHRQEFAQWQSGAHSASYAAIFLDSKHNRNRLLMDDCLRCHGMFSEGGIRDLVAPVDARGPWRLLPEGLADQSAIPCLVCHQMHVEGGLMGKSRPDVKAAPGRQELYRPSLALYDRRTSLHYTVGILPLPRMREGDRVVAASPDPRQALCYQCHAPLASMQAGSGDDRTPLGVHEGLSCLACHQKHGQMTRASCADCHPRLSNCGLDVEKMDTTFASLQSAHNIHFVKCVDCHPKGAPRKNGRAGSAQTRASAH